MSDSRNDHAVPVTERHLKMAERFYKEKELNYKNMAQMYVGGHMAAFGAGGYLVSRILSRSDRQYTSLRDLNLPFIDGTPLAGLPIFTVVIATVALGALLVPLTIGMMKSKALRGLVIAIFLALLISAITLGAIAYTQSPRWVIGFWLDRMPEVLSLGVLFQICFLSSVIIGIPVLASGLKKPEPVTKEMLRDHARRLARQEELAKNPSNFGSPSRRRRRR